MIETNFILIECFFFKKKEIEKRGFREKEKKKTQVRKREVQIKAKRNSARSGVKICANEFFVYPSASILVTTRRKGGGLGVELESKGKGEVEEGKGALTRSERKEGGRGEGVNRIKCVAISFLTPFLNFICGA